MSWKKHELFKYIHTALNLSVMTGIQSTWIGNIEVPVSPAVQLWHSLLQLISAYFSWFILSELQNKRLDTFQKAWR